MPRELRPLAARLRLRRDRRFRGRLYRGDLAGRPAAGLVTGMGSALACAAIRQLLDYAAIGQVMVTGTSGALDDSTPIGMVIAPDLVIDGASGRQFRPAPLPGGGQRGTLWTSDTLITDPAALRALRERGVVALDMETAAIASECEARGIRWSVLRAISDRAGDGSVDARILGLNHQDGSPDAAAIARFLLGRPSRIRQLATLARGARLGVTAAADAAISACAHR
jgi:adenosylhomocysteine nucleosidase